MKIAKFEHWPLGYLQNVEGKTLKNILINFSLHHWRLRAYISFRRRETAFMLEWPYTVYEADESFTGESNLICRSKGCKLLMCHKCIKMLILVGLQTRCFSH